MVACKFEIVGCRARGRGRLPQALKAAHLRVSRQALALAAQVLQPALTQLVAGRSLASSPSTIRWDAWQFIAGILHILIQLVLEAARQADGAGSAYAPARGDSTGGRKKSRIFSFYHEVGQGWANGWKAQHRALGLQWCVQPYCSPAGECWDALLLLRRGTGQLPHWRYF